LAAIFPACGVGNEETAMELKGTKTHDNLKAASRANRRRTGVICIANQADVEGQNDVAAVFRSTAEGK
jgi:hypothetical protein